MVVSDVADKAVAAGAGTFKESMAYGFMHTRSFQDLDGHIREWLWMDPATVKEE